MRAEILLGGTSQRLGRGANSPAAYQSPTGLRHRLADNSIALRIHPIAHPETPFPPALSTEERLASQQQQL
jgi:hypothetical protein